MGKKLLVLALVSAVACGDDSSDGPGPSENDAGRDAGQTGSDGGPTIDAGADGGRDIDAGAADGGVDGSSQAGDGGTDGDAGESAELTQARVTVGVDGSDSRKNILLAAFCKRAPVCSSDATEADCLAVFEEEWTSIVASGASDACRDADLDRVACLIGVACNADAPCAEFEAPVWALCEDDAGML